MNHLYIPLCLYQYLVTFSAKEDMKNLYIPLCLYQYSNSQSMTPTDYSSTFHSVYISTGKPIGINIPTWLSTFHSVYISTLVWAQTEDGRNNLYIPLCLYQYLIGKVARSVMTPLHSTLFILVHGSRTSQRNKQQTLHSTLFILVLVDSCLFPPSCYLYIPLCLYQYSETAAKKMMGTYSTFHSVYISTKLTKL